MKFPTQAQLDAIRPLGTSLVADAVDTFKVRLQNEGFIAHGGIRCMTAGLGPMLGYAVTARVRTLHPPLKGTHFAENQAWWNYVRSLPEPRVLVLYDFDNPPGAGAFMGEMHTAVHQALGCVGVVTNGAVRDVRKIAAMGFGCFAASRSVSRAYAHIAEYGVEIELGGLPIKPGDLLYGDENGILSIPKPLVPELPAAAAAIAERRRQTAELCRTPQFSTEELRELTALFGYAVADSSMIPKKKPHPAD